MDHQIKNWLESPLRKLANEMVNFDLLYKQTIVTVELQWMY